MSSWMDEGKRATKAQKHTFILGIDTGGTFTDLVCMDSSGNMRRWKLLSTPKDPSLAILRGLQELLGSFRPDELEIVHGTTVGTNAFLERKGAKTCLITTRGFEDVIFIGRQNRPSLYDFMVEKPAPIIDRQQIYGVLERTLHNGQIQEKPSIEELEKVVDFCRRNGAESVAICLLHAYANPENENKLSAILEKNGFRPYPSSEILPEFREFERTSTTVINAYLGPVVGDYVNHLQEALPGSRIYIQQSNGGCRPATGIGRYAVTTLLSGPAGGVAASFHLGRSLGFGNIITFDMGGTSTDVSLCAQDFSYTREYKIEGFPVGLPMIDIHTVGAGGGSIAWIDKGGFLRVGPESAGADPGPVCYGKGDRLTVTDANLFLGRLRPEAFLGGRMRLYKDRVLECMERFAKRAGMSPEEAALGIVKIVNANMIQAIRSVSLERGFDPREFVLVGFGGAAGLHCLELAGELGIDTVLVPDMAGVFSATGMAGADLILEASSSLFLTTGEDIRDVLERYFFEIESKLRASAPVTPTGQGPTIERFMDARYQGQSFEITVPFGNGWERDFHLIHERLYGYCMPELTIEITAIRSRLRLRRSVQPRAISSVNITEALPSAPNAREEQKAEILFEDGIKQLPVIYKKWAREKGCLSGPALIIDDFTTILIPEGWKTNWISGHLLAKKK